MREILGYEGLPHLPVAIDAVTPDPGGADAAGVVIWSTSDLTMLYWTGSLWSANWNSDTPAPSDAAPANVGTAAPGVGTTYSREDHVHELPAVGTAGSFTNANITLDAKGRVTAAANGSGSSGANVAISRLSADLSRSGQGASAAQAEANTNVVSIFELSVPANTMLHVEAVIDFTSGGATNGVVLGANVTTNAAGSANVKLNASIVVPLTNAAATSSLERIAGTASTALNATVGVALVGTASVSPQAALITSTLVNLGDAAVTFRIVFGSEANNTLTVALANSSLLYCLQAI